MLFIGKIAESSAIPSLRLVRAHLHRVSFLIGKTAIFASREHGNCRSSCYADSRISAIEIDRNYMLQPAHEILEIIARVAPGDAFEARHIESTLTFVRHNTETFWCRSNLAGHLTASIFVLDSRGQAALLLHHAALDKWLQPGGHIDHTDHNIAAAALRELHEEAGFDVARVSTPTLFDVDAHPIPARVKAGVAEPAHIHYDLRFLARATDDDVAISDEARGFRWVSLAELAAREPESGIGRMARKALNEKSST